MKKGIIILILITLSVWTFTLVMSRQIDRAFEQVYQKGFKDGIKSVKLEDVCCGMEKKGEMTDFIKGRHFEIYECYVDVGNWQDYWDVSDDFETIPK